MVLLGCISSAAKAEIALSYDPVVVPVDAVTDVTLSLTTNPGIDSSAAVILFEFDTNVDYQQLNPLAFKWDEVFSDAQNWIVGGELPNPAAVTFGAGIELPDDLEVVIGTLSIAPMKIGTWSLAANLRVFDEFFEVEVKGGDPQEFVVVPEPTTFGLLAFGLLAAGRRFHQRDDRLTDVLR